MFRGALGAACAASLIALALVGSAAARVAHMPCPNAAGGPYAGHEALHNLPDEILYKRYSEYRECGPLRGIPDGDTKERTVQCRPGFKLADTTTHSHNPHSAGWDFFSQHGEWVTCDGRGHFHTWAGWATGYTAELHNWNLSAGAQWPVMMFATCKRIPDYYA